MANPDEAPTPKPRMVGLNHIAIEVGSIEEAMGFYGRVFDLRLRGRGEGAAFVDLGDQFLAMMEGPVHQPPGHRHLGLVVDDRSGVMAAAQAAGATRFDANTFVDPWGNRVEVVQYRDIQFTKAPEVLRGMGVAGEKTPEALEELARKGLGPG